MRQSWGRWVAFRNGLDAYLFAVTLLKVEFRPGLDRSLGRQIGNSHIVRVLGIETSCDETGVAIYDGELGLMSHALYSQAHIHAEYGGVVPEIASRDHVRKLLPLIDQCLEQAGTVRSELGG